MTRRIDILAATVGACLLLAVSGSSAQPVEPCMFDGQQGHSFDTINGLTGFHEWRCTSGTWQYVRYCGDAMCPLT